MRHVPRVRALNLTSHRIHTLCDLVGYTGGGEKANEVFAVRPAAHAWSYMGFCASSGAACVPAARSFFCFFFVACLDLGRKSPLTRRIFRPKAKKPKKEEVFGVQADSP